MRKVPYNGAQTISAKSNSPPTTAPPYIGEDSHYILKEFLTLMKIEPKSCKKMILYRSVYRQISKNIRKLNIYI